MTVSRRNMLAAATLGSAALSSALAVQAPAVYAESNSRSQRRVPFIPGEPTKALFYQIFNTPEQAFPGHLSEQVPWKEGSYAWFDRAKKDWDVEAK